MPPGILLLHPIRQHLISIVLLNVLPKAQAADLHVSYLLQILISCLVRTLDGICVKLLARLYVSQILLQFFVTSAHLHVTLLYVLYICGCTVCIANMRVRVCLNT
jgi:hypothetical protein